MLGKHIVEHILLNTHGVLTVGAGKQFSQIQDAIDVIKTYSPVTLWAGITGTLNAVATGDKVITSTGGNYWGLNGNVHAADALPLGLIVWTPDNVTFYRITNIFNNDTFKLAHPYSGAPLSAGGAIYIGNANTYNVEVSDGVYDALDMENGGQALFINIRANTSAVIYGSKTSAMTGNQASVIPPYSGIIDINGFTVLSNVGGFMNQAMLNGTEIYLNDITQHSPAVDVIAAPLGGVGIFKATNCKFEFVQDGIDVEMSGDQFAIFENCDIYGTQRKLVPGITLLIRAVFSGTNIKFNDCRFDLKTFDGKSCVLADLGMAGHYIFNNCDVDCFGDGSGSGSPLATTTSVNTLLRVDVYGGVWNVAAGDSLIEPVVYGGTGIVNFIGFDKNSIPVGGGGTLTVNQHNTFN